MSGNRVIPLPESFTAHGKTYTSLILRQPSYDEYVTCGGEPYSIGESAEGVLFTVEKPEVIWAYAQVLIVEPDPILLGSMDWRLAREVRKAIMGFFQAPAAAAEPSPTSPTTSSSS